jgi:hypothetical protein
MANIAKNSVNSVAQEPQTFQVAQPKSPKLIVAQQKFNRWYVYFQGVKPSENVGCGCKSAKSAIRYIHLLKHRYGAVVSQNVYDRLAFEAAKEA